MPTIGNNLLPYPNTSDAPNIPQAISELASAVDTAIGGGGRLIQTLTDLQAIPTAQLFEGLSARVIADSSTANNGEYIYSSGKWSMAGRVTKINTFTWVDTNASNTKLLVDLYDCGRFALWLVSCTGNLSGLAPSTNYTVASSGAVPQTYRLPSDASGSGLYLINSSYESLNVANDGSIVFGTASSTSTSTAHWPRAAVMIPKIA